MALSAALLSRLPPALLKHGLGSSISASRPASSLSLGREELNRVFPDHGLPRGAVVELSVRGPAALGTTLGLAACHSAQQAALACGGSVPWCAFIDPSGSLYAPGVAAAEVALDHLLVVRPPLDALCRVTLRMAEAHIFPVIIVDTMGVPGQALELKFSAWVKVVRKLTLAVEGTSHSVVLLTNAAAHRALPLPVAQRIELTRPFEDRLVVRVVKDKQGRVSSPRPVAWVRKPSDGNAPQHVRKLA
jgi:recombination protein RecA